MSWVLTNNPKSFDKQTNTNKSTLKTEKIRSNCTAVHRDRNTIVKYQSVLTTMNTNMNIEGAESLSLHTNTRSAIDKSSN